MALVAARTSDSNACATEQLTTIPDLAGIKFETTYTSCDTLVKTEAVSVYASRAAAGGESWLSRWRNRKALLFRYDPGRWDNPPPSIRVAGKGRIVISIPQVSSVMFQSRRWRDVSIDYDIGRIGPPLRPPAP